MTPKRKFPPEADTKPSARGSTTSEAPTLPPPPPVDESETVKASVPAAKRDTVAPKVSGVRPRPRTSHSPAATVDEVTADMRRDPRREED